MEVETIESVRKDAAAGRALLRVAAPDMNVVSYPYGRSNDAARAALIEAGFAYGVTTERRGMTGLDDAMKIPRYDANDVRDYLNK